MGAFLLLSAVFFPSFLSPVLAENSMYDQFSLLLLQSHLAKSHDCTGIAII